MNNSENNAYSLNILPDSQITLKSTGEVINPIADQTYKPESTNAQSGTAVAEAINTKVDKVSGKGLSTNDLTNALKETYDNKSDFSGSYDDLTDKPTTDQEYNSESTNAQSGTAVAEAIASIPAPKGMEWVTLKEITTTENVHSVTLTIFQYSGYSDSKGIWLSVKAPEGVTAQSEYNYLIKAYYSIDGVNKSISTTVAGNGGTNKTLCEHITLPIGDMYLRFMVGNTSYSGNLYAPINNSVLLPYKPRQFVIVLNAGSDIGFPAGVIMTVKGLKEVTE